MLVIGILAYLGGNCNPCLTKSLHRGILSFVKEQSLTPKGILLDMRLKDAGHPGLLDYIAAQRDSGATWATIAADIEAVTGLRVTDMGVRYWMEKAQGAAA